MHQNVLECIMIGWNVKHLHRQSGHGRRVAQAHYAIDEAFLHRLGPELITAFEQASIAWHRLWELKSTGRAAAAASQGLEASRQLTGQHPEASQQLTDQPGPAPALVGASQRPE